MSGMEDQARRRQRAAQYRAARRSEAGVAEDENDDGPQVSYVGNVAEQADAAIKRAEARGDFDNLAYAGKPIPGLGATLDPDWWVKGLIEREQLTGLAPAPFQLRKDDAALDGELDRQSAEANVRELLGDFNARVVDARRQLQGGPPVVTSTRDVEKEVLRWRARRMAAPQPEATPVEPAPARRAWWRRRRSPG
ncbi:DUF1992 domain-containing protein [Arthrobacter sp. H5]|uniref:DnaJ family domain-containing protein n=1 Tax=Arthrobacter sp. H5 TaxID=1267973 RepID=UPI0004850584|nr:DUF1992 domain-containing protein [Arthrobacter sp. H5]